MDPFTPSLLQNAAVITLTLGPRQSTLRLVEKMSSCPPLKRPSDAGK